MNNDRSQKKKKLEQLMRILGNRKECPKCGFPFPWADAWFGTPTWIWDRWQCELCKSTVGYSSIRRIIAVIIAVAISYFISMIDSPFFVKAILIVFAWTIAIYLIDGVTIKEKKAIN